MNLVTSSLRISLQKIAAMEGLWETEPAPAPMALLRLPTPN